MDKLHCKKLIENYPLFFLLSHEDIDGLVHLMTEVFMGPDKVVVKEGDVIDSFYLIAEGNAKVIRTHETIEKKEAIQVALLKEGDSVGWTHKGFFSLTGFRTATVISLTPLRLYKIDVKTFQSFIDSPTRHYASLKNTQEKFILMNFIQQTFLLQYLSSVSIRHLAKKMKRMVVSAGNNIFKSYDNTLYFLIEGEVVLSCEGEKTQEVTVAPGQFFPQKVLFSTALEEMEASAQARQDCTLFKFTREDLIASISGVTEDVFFLPLIHSGILSCEIIAAARPKNSHDILSYCASRKPISEVMTYFEKEKNIPQEETLNSIFNLGKQGDLSSVSSSQKLLGRFFSKLFSKRKE